MNTKMPGLVAGSMLAILALAPMGLAHQGTTDPEGSVSGTYVGGAGPWVQFDMAPVKDLNGNDVVDPSFLFAAGAGFCDLEILSDGAAVNQDLDETNVDDAHNMLATVNQPDGLWDDGGLGVVCHTPDTHYDEQLFNTQDCDFDTANTAVGANGVATATQVGSDVWISATCDFMTQLPSEDDPLGLDSLFAAESACSSAALTLPGSLSDGGVAACTAAALDFATTGVPVIVKCLTGQGTATCPVSGSGATCGPDGSVDASNDGFGSSGVPYPSFSPCGETDGVAAVFVWNAVFIDGDAMTHTEYPATVGTVS